MKKIIITSLLIAAIAAGFAYARAADEVHSIQLPNIATEIRPGEGRDKVAVYCNICHSLDYITTQPGFSRAQWTGTVSKMIKVFGAPVNEGDAKIIINYLSMQYGTGK